MKFIRNQTELWQKHFEQDLYDENYPSESVIRFLMRYKKNFGGNAKILDLGCGVGRHLLLALENGFEGWGIDIVEASINKAKQKIEAKGYKTELSIGPMDILPYKDNFFNIVISFGVFDHVLFRTAQKGMAEVRRVLKQDGKVFFKLETNDSPEIRYGEKIEENTYIITSDCEKGIVQHYYTKDEINSLFSDFYIESFEKEEYQDVIHNNIVLSRWHISARNLK